MLEAKGIKGLVFIENGLRSFSNNVRPIHTPADMKGLKMRVMEAPVYLKTMTAFGANPTPMAFSELYSALQQGTVDGQDNGIVLTLSAKLHEVQKYYTVSEYCYAPATTAVNLAWWAGLNEPTQKVIMDALVLMRDEMRKLNAQMEEDGLEQMKAAGVEVNVLTPEEKDAFKALVGPVWDEVKCCGKVQVKKRACRVSPNPLMRQLLLPAAAQSAGVSFLSGV